MTTLLHTRDELRNWLNATHGPRGVVLTMGALHAGHEQLMRVARDEVGRGGTVLVTVFVNPTQFGPGEDFSRYPRTLNEDFARCEALGVDAVFAPDVDEVYPPGEQLADYDPGPLGRELEGEARPGHFAGVMKVVSRLLQLTRADVTCFGEKDYQQLVIVQRLQQLEPALATCRIVGVPIVRDADGLALSSRNRFLHEPDRAHALAIPECVKLVQDSCMRGISAAQSEAQGRAFLMASAGIDPDYVSVRSVTLGPAPTEGEARVLVAARVAGIRLLDNGPVTLRGDA